MTARFYWPAPYSTGNHELPDAIAHHAFRVCRLKKNDPLILFDGNNHEAHAHCVDPFRAIVSIRRIETISRESPLTTLLIQALPALDRMDFIIQKAVELGVTQIQPVESLRSIIRLKDNRAEKKQAHWKRLIVASCEQCGRTQLPELLPVLPLEEALQHHAVTASCRWLLSPHTSKRLSLPDFPVTSIQLLAGPEGGFSQEEETLAIKQGFLPIRLGPRVLRTETAGLTALSICQWHFGDFQLTS